MSKGRDSKLIEARNRRLFERYFYWTEERRLRFDDTIRILSNEEFYLSESRVLHIIRDMIKRGETVDGKQINSGDYMAILEKEIIFNEKDKLAVTKELIKKMCDEDTEVVTLIKGSEATDEECEEIRQFIEQNYNVDIDVEDGQQPVYSFIIGAE